MLRTAAAAGREGERKLQGAGAAARWRSGAGGAPDAGGGGAAPATSTGSSSRRLRVQLREAEQVMAAPGQRRWGQAEASGQELSAAASGLEGATH